MNNNFSRYILEIILLGLVCHLGAFDFTSDGKALFEIVLPDDAVEMEQRAAEEVAESIQRMAGCRPTIIHEKETRSLPKAMYIGQTRNMSLHEAAEKACHFRWLSAPTIEPL